MKATSIKYIQFFVFFLGSMKLFQDGIFKDGAVETENRKRRKSYQRSEDAQTVSLQVCL